MVGVAAINLSKVAVIVTTLEPVTILLASVSVKVTDGAQVPQTGLLESINDELVEKSAGSDAMVETHQPDKSWLKLSALLNIAYISVTLVVFQLLISWLKLSASKNITAIVVTLLTFQPLISWLKLLAYLNIFIISVTLEVFQLLKFPLKLSADWNISFIVVTLLTSQLLMF